jgi:uncharacterized membrane protein YkoI
MEDINKLNDEVLEDVSGGVLTQEEALASALTHAKLKKGDLDFVKKVEMDFEHGRRIYEIEFYKDGFEYEYDIDAVTGKVLKFKKDWD